VLLAVAIIDRMNVKEIRRINMLTLIEEVGSQKRLGELTDTPPSYFSQVKNRTRAMGDSVAYRIESMLKKSAGWMDVIHHVSEESPAYLASARYVPILETDQVLSYLEGEINDVKQFQALDSLQQKLQELSQDAFCIISQTDAVDGIVPGSILVIDPSLEAQPGSPSMWDINGEGIFSVGVYVKHGTVEQLRYDNASYQSDTITARSKRIGAIVMVIRDYR